MNEAGCATPRVLQLGFTTADAERCAGFYRRYLGFGEPQELVFEGGALAQVLGLPLGRFKLLRLPLGNEWLEITQVLDAGPAQRAGHQPPADSRSCDRWFQHLCLVSSDLDAALQQLQPALASGLAQAVSRAPQTLPASNTAAAGIRAFKFKDPEGHNLELLQFPAGKGEPRWHQGNTLAGTSLLGIDHSAISIGDSARSCRFYDALLGLRLGGDGINSGPTQDDLDGLQQTRVRITGHRCPQGPGIECLDYQDPNRGRPMPADLGVQDLFHWQIRLQIDDLNALVDQIEPLGGRVLGPGLVELGDQGPLLGGRLALQVADPDGHRLQLVQR